MTKTSDITEHSVQWVADGPKIPVKLVQGMHDGKVVMFCGAGVSMRAGLPGFPKLVRTVHSALGEQVPKEPRGHDERLARLELRYQSRSKVRHQVRKQLTLAPGADLRTHSALLDLATTKNHVRIVTTNFDRAFLGCANAPKQVHQAPFLPLPKSETWNSLVHLHGLLPEDDDEDCEDLVLSSSDFGRAYLTERWASRFLSELFRRFTVLFVGYSTDDPVMRYTLDALAADRQLADQHETESAYGEAYILTAIEGTEEETKRRWRDRNVHAIPYSKEGGHRLLHDTLVEWASAHRSGAEGRCEIISRYAAKFPEDPMPRSQVLWAVRDPVGAKHFAGFTPLPPIEWLDEFERLGISATNESVTPSFFLSGAADLGEASKALVWWIGRHAKASTPELIDRVLKAGSNLHPRVTDTLLQELNNGNLPDPCDRIWRAILHYGPLQHAFPWSSSVDKLEWTIANKLALLRCLEPIPLLEPAISRDYLPASELGHYVSARVTVRTRNMTFHLLTQLASRPNHSAIYRELLDPVSSLLDRAMEIEELFGHADPDRDPSQWQRPSISPSSQNQDYYPWVALIELACRGWDAVSSDSVAARAIVSRWRHMRYPVFRRLVLHALSVSEAHTFDEKLDVLLEGDWLWLGITRREGFRLLMTIWPSLNPTQSARVMSRLLEGPSERLRPENTASEWWVRHCDRERWLRLNALDSLRALEEEVKSQFNTISIRYGWNGPHDEKAEFEHWTGPATSLPYDWAEASDPAYMGLSVEEVKSAAALEPDPERLIRCWRAIFRDRREIALTAFFDCLALRRQSKCWKDVLLVRNEWDVIKTRWLPAFAEDVLSIAEESLPILTHIVSQSLERVAKDLSEGQQEWFWIIWDHLYIPAFREAILSGNIHFQALNSSAGYLAQAYLKWLGSRGINALSEIDSTARKRLDDLAGGNQPGHHYSHYFLIRDLSWLFRLDATWAESKLMPLLDGPATETRKDLWRGLVSSGSMSSTLWLTIKPLFLAQDLQAIFVGDVDSESSALIILSRARLFYPKSIPVGRMKHFLRKSTAEARSRLLEGLESYLYQDESPLRDNWKSRVKPFIQKCWPGGPEFRSADEAAGFARLAIAANDHFSDALSVVKSYMTKISPHNNVVHMVKQTGRATQYPSGTLELLATILQADDSQLGPVLDEIRMASPSLASDPRFIKLQNLPVVP